MKSQRALILLLVVALASVASSCRLNSLAFRADHRLKVLEPKDRAQVSFPVTVRWGLRENIPGLGSFAVFVNRSPQAPGQSFEALVKDLNECRGTALSFCLQPEFLADRGIYQTTEQQITFDVIARRTGVSKSEENRHEVRVALLDAAGRRIGEAGWMVTFTVRD